MRRSRCHLQKQADEVLRGEQQFAKAPDPIHNGTCYSIAPVTEKRVSFLGRNTYGSFKPSAQQSAGAK